MIKNERNKAVSLRRGGLHMPVIAVVAAMVLGGGVALSQYFVQPVPVGQMSGGTLSAEEIKASEAQIQATLDFRTKMKSMTVAQLVDCIKTTNTDELQRADAARKLRLMPSQERDSLIYAACKDKDVSKWEIRELDAVIALGYVISPKAKALLEDRKANSNDHSVRYEAALSLDPNRNRGQWNSSIHKI